ncbi:hypothetical protein Bca52824_055469 [Brassica carinata]|uniref:Calcineurin B-like protein n=1 Tax=Brassica carinata TaxID=52824 RepID=A0A8X7UMU8_BRACI|nr:hypothetical protein Bca52824_055469 [Brassica carinata]
MGCSLSKKKKIAIPPPGYEDPDLLASVTPFTAAEVEVLYELFKKLSSSIIDDGLIHKEEFQLALLGNRNRNNLFADRIFDVFDVKRNGVIEFGEFVRSLGVFHPNAPVHEKIKFAFKLYDLRQTGFIEREEVSLFTDILTYIFIILVNFVCCSFIQLKEMVIALLHESELVLSEEMIEVMVDKAFTETDRNNDGKIDVDEWKDLVSMNPALIKNMTLPYLKDIKATFPSFVLSSEDEELELQNLYF